MKRFILPLCLVLMLLPGISKAQFYPYPHYPGLHFDLNFIAISNSPAPDSTLTSEAEYYYHNLSFNGGLATNDWLWVFIQLPGTAQDAWILRLEDNGSFTP